MSKIGDVTDGIAAARRALKTMISESEANHFLSVRLGSVEHKLRDADELSRRVEGYLREPSSPHRDTLLTREEALNDLIIAESLLYRVLSGLPSLPSGIANVLHDADIYVRVAKADLKKLYEKHGEDTPREFRATRPNRMKLALEEQWPLTQEARREFESEA